MSAHRNLLEPMIDQINSEDVDLVVVTGDLVQSKTEELFDLAKSNLNKINHKVVVIPGEYDSCDLWDERFGDRYKHLHIKGYDLDFLDTSFIGGKFSVGWGDLLSEDTKQYSWFKKNLENDNYHIVFSHHPFLIDPSEKNEFFVDNLRATYSGHLREVSKFYFKYDKPKSSFDFGFSTTSLKFHGNSCYLLILVDENNEIANVPRLLNIKKTAW